MRIREQRPIEFRQLCAIVRVVILATPTMTDADWKGATLDACSKQGWAYPEGDMLARALGAVERALQETGFQRQETTAPVSAAAVTVDRGWSPADYQALAATMRTISAKTAPGAVQPTVIEVEIEEPAALDQFWAEASTDAIGALKRFAEIAIVRPPEWDFKMARAADTRRIDGITLSATQCFACHRAAERFQWHHVIQIQHGGSNHPRNRVALCFSCHHKVHPWLPAPQERGWYSFNDVAPYAIAEELRRGRKVAS